jgi:hypothetical protein
MVQSPAQPKGQSGALLAARVRAVAIGLLVLGVVCIGATHGPLIGYKTYANVDEAYAVALASRLLDGFKLYQGAISQRGPLMYYAFELIAWLHGWDNIVALRLWALGLVLVHFVLIYATAKTMLPRTGVLVATFVAAYGFIFGFPPFDGIALHGETLQMPALLGSVLLGGVGTLAVVVVWWFAFPQLSRRDALMPPAPGGLPVNIATRAAGIRTVLRGIALQHRFAQGVHAVGHVHRIALGLHGLERVEDRLEDR